MVHCLLQLFFFFFFYTNVKALFTTKVEKLTFPFHTEAEPEVQTLLVSDVSSQSFRLNWTAEEDAMDTFVIMVTQPEGTAEPRELVMAGEERSVAVADLTEDTEYSVEIFGLVLGKRSKSILKMVRTGIW